MRKINGKGLMIAATMVLGIFIYSCDKDDDNMNDTIRSTEYQLNAVGNSGVDGKVTITENADKSFNVMVNIDTSVKDTVHVLSIYNGTPTNPGTVAIPLGSITGTGGAAQGLTQNINSVTWPDNSVHPITYDSLLIYAGYINVFYSASRMDSVLTQANIGANN